MLFNPSAPGTRVLPDLQSASLLHEMPRPLWLDCVSLVALDAPPERRQVCIASVGWSGPCLKWGRLPSGFSHGASGPNDPAGTHSRRQTISVDGF